MQGRCVIASSDHCKLAISYFFWLLTYISAQDGLRDALRFFSQSEQDYKALEMLQPLLDVYYYKSIIYHNLRMEAERDEASLLHANCEEEHKHIAAIPWDKGYQELWDVVSHAGGALTYQR